MMAYRRKDKEEEEDEEDEEDGQIQVFRAW